MPPYASINLHPSSHLPSGVRTTSFDVIAIGSGWAGRVICEKIIKAGLSAVVIESELVGGDCPFWACVPSKALLRPGDLIEDAVSTGGVKEKVDPATVAAKPPTPQVDVQASFTTRDGFSTGWDDSKLLVPMVEGAGTVIVRGTGKLVGEKKVEVTNVNGEKVVLTANHAVAVCTGSVARIPDIPGLKEAKPWTSREAVSSSSVPKRLAVIGAGAVGTEMAVAYASFGSKVTLVMPPDEILPAFDAEAGKLVREGLGELGIDVLVKTRATSVERDQQGGTATVALSTGGSIEVDEIVVAAGRLANTWGTGLQTFGLPADGSPIPVDESLCVASVPGGWLYAGGDVNGRATLTHHSKYHGWVISNAIIAKARGGNVSTSEPYSRTTATADHFAVPQVVFTNPALASVGLTKKGAEAAGKKVRVITAGFFSVGSLILQGKHTQGWAQWVIEEPTNKLLGATLVGKDVGDLLHPSTVAVVAGLTIDQLAHALPPFPTVSEVYLNLLEAAGV